MTQSFKFGSLLARPVRVKAAPGMNDDKFHKISQDKLRSHKKIMINHLSLGLLCDESWLHKIWS